jgi:aspartokinase-like uncharacterized kinase
MIVIKVGGSLFDRPSLRDDLRAYLAPFDESRVELVAGGGHSAEAVRTYDRIHRLGEETSHHLAVQSLVVTRHLLDELTDRRFRVLDACAFCGSQNSLPRTWAVTTDSIAAQYAQVIRAERLILLKSVMIPAGTGWRTAVANGWVDDHFPIVAERLKCRIDVVTLPSINARGSGSTR